MFITKIKIENFRSIKEIVLDFKSNIHQSQDDIDFRAFRKTTDGKHIIPPFIAIMGRNSIGKTTILDAIMLFSDLYKGTLNRLAIEKATQTLLSKMVPKDTAFEINPSNPLNNINIKIMEARNKIVESINDKEKHSSDEFLIYQSALSSVLKDIHSSNALSQYDPIKMTLSMDGKDIEGQQEISLIINEDGTSKIITKCEERISEKMISYIQRIEGHERKYEIIGSGFWGLDINENANSAQFYNSILRMKSQIGKKNTIKLMQLADPEIKDIIFLDSRNNNSEWIEGFKLFNDKTISEEWISNGTKQFIYLFSKLLTNYKLVKEKKGGYLVLIDEIEIGTHTELINTIKLAMQHLFEELDIQFIFTTHSPLALDKYVSFKQVFSISKDNDEHKINKLSSKFKPSHSIINLYKNGQISEYPDKEWSRNIIFEVL